MSRPCFRVDRLIEDAVSKDFRVESKNILLAGIGKGDRQIDDKQSRWCFFNLGFHNGFDAICSRIRIDSFFPTVKTAEENTVKKTNKKVKRDISAFFQNQFYLA
jgi:hypothetical protein